VLQFDLILRDVVIHVIYTDYKGSTVSAVQRSPLAVDVIQQVSKFSKWVILHFPCSN
jgi:hypothetical protein